MNKNIGKKLFLIDGVGALLSVFLLGIVLPYFNSYIGMPKQFLYFLSGLAIVLFAFDITCYYMVNKKWKFYLRVLALFNLAYSIFSLCLVIFHFEKLTKLGVLYFLLEIMILLLLAKFEFNKSVIEVD